MKAAVTYGLNDLRVEEVATPVLTPGSLLVKVHACAICGSDIRILTSGNSRVAFPAIMGHETAGEIIGVGPGVKNWKMGDRVALGADIPCGTCTWCTNGMGNCCDQNYALGYQFSGAFAEYCLLEPMVVQYGPIVLIPKNVSYEEAALMEPIACILNGFELVNMQVGKSVLIFGAGPIGCLGIGVAKALGASQVIMAEISEKRLSQAKKFGADHYLNPADPNFVDEVRQLTGGQGVDRIFTMCPAVAAHEQALTVVAKRGYINLFGGLPKNTRPAQFSSNQIHYQECFITGSHGSTPRHNNIAMSLIASGKINAAELITHRFSLDEIHQGITMMQDLSGLKAIIRPNIS